jgi:intracellular proteinase inhibitor BsuPI
MSRSLAFVLATLVVTARLSAQEPAGTPEKRSWFNRLLHPFGSSNPIPSYKDARLRGLLLEMKLSPEPVKLSEVRQLQVSLTLKNVSKRAVILEFPSEQRFEIYLRNSTEAILTIWSDNHAFEDKPATVLINPAEHIDYPATIATRDLSPNKVFIAEAFFPQFPELRVRQKFLTAP